MKNGLQGLALRFLRSFCPTSLYEGIEGDLREQFETDTKEVGEKKARRRLAWNVIRFFRPGIIFRNAFPTTVIPIGMIKNYFKVAWRSMARHRAYTFINIMGLTFGLAVAIMLFWIVRFEYSFDRFHSKADRLYQIRTFDKFGSEANSQVPQGVIHVLQNEFPTVEKAAVVYRWDPQVIRVREENLKQENTFFMHPEFLEMIDVHWVKGSPSQSLSRAYQVVLDEPTAGKLFPNEDPMGKVIRYDNAMELTVSGVIGKMPVNSEFQLQMMMSYETLTKYMGEYANLDYWGGGDSQFHGYVLMRPGTEKEAVEMQLAKLAGERGEQSNFARFELSPLTASHYDMETDPFYYVVQFWMLQVLMAIAAFLIIIACINFINLATAQASQRSREVGLRKVMGGGRLSIVGQFFTETFVLVSFSVLLASLLATELVRHANYFFNTNVNQVQVWDSPMILYCILLIAGVTVLSASYPAFVLSGFDPLSALRNKIASFSRSGVSLRSSLVVVQFVMAQVLVICMVVGIKQITFFYETDPGFDKEVVITVTMPHKDSVLLQERFRHHLLQHPEIKAVSFSLTTPSSDRNWWWGGVKSPGILELQTFRLQWVDNSYFDFYNIPLVAGRSFSATDTLPMALVNEKAVQAAGLKDPEEILGTELTYWGSNKVAVIGVVKDYYSQSFKAEIVPHLFMNGDWNFQLAQIKIDQAQTASAIGHIEASWRELHPDNYFEYEFLSESLDAFYENEDKMSNFIKLFAFVGILIGCLGLYGLVSFVCARRTKEVSIRKILGATLSNILVLLSKNFLILLIVAFVIAIPIGWFAMDRFLQEYTYKIEIDWTVFAWAGSLTMTLALLTIVLKSVRTVLINPAETLKYE